MKLLTRKILAASAANGFIERYPTSGKDIYWQVRKLGDNPDPDDVDKAIGNVSWTRVICDECDKCVDEAVALGEVEGYFSATLTICKPCLKAALELTQQKEYQ